MTISAEIPELIATAAPGQTVFAFDFRLFQPGDIDVFVDRTLAVYTPSPLVILEYDLVILPLPSEGGSITFGLPLAGGEVVEIYRAVPIERATNFPPSGPVPMDAINLEFDRHIAIMQDLDAGVSGIQDRALMVPVPETVPQLPPASERAQGILGFDADGNPVILPSEELGSVAVVAQRREVVAVAGQTIFQTNAVYTVGYVSVYVNGVRLSEQEFIATDGVNVVLAQPCVAGDIVLLEGFLGSAAAGSTNDLTFIQAGAGAVSRNAQGKMREVFSVADFGAKGDYNTATGTGSDDTAAFVAAIAALGPTGGRIWVPRNFKCLINSSFTLPNNVVLVGEASVGESFPAGLLNRGSTLYIATTATISLQNGAGFRGVNLFRKGLQFNITSAQMAAQFLGRAVTLLNDTSDHIFQDMLILGFLEGVATQSTTGAVYVARTKFLGTVGMDCTTCVQIYNASDIPILDGLECWPYVTVMSPPEADGAQLKRNGYAVRLRGLNDWTKLHAPFNYGYIVGFAITDGGACTITCGGCDYPGQSVTDNSVGYIIDGIAEEIRLIGPQVAARSTGVAVASTSANLAVTIIGGNYWECIERGVAVSVGDVQIIGGCTRSGRAGSRGVVTGPAAGEVMVYGHDFRNLDRAFVNDNSAVRLRHRDCTFRNLVHLDPTNAYEATIASADPLILNGTDTAFVVTGNVSFGSLYFGNTYAGKLVTLMFTGNLNISSLGNIHLVGGVSMAATPYDTLTLLGRSDTHWYEVARSVL